LKITEKWCFGGKFEFYSFLARADARVRFDVKNEFDDCCRVGFHFESLSLDEN